MLASHMIIGLSTLMATFDTPRIECLAWLEGTWTGSAFGGTIDEVFGSPAGGSILGTSRVVADGKLNHREFILMLSET